METVKEESVKKIKVWFIEPFGRGGIAYYLLSLLKALSQKDLAITLWTTNDFELRPFVSGFQLEEAFRIRFEKTGATATVWSSQLKKGRGFLKGLLMLRKELRRKAPEILHFQSGFLALTDFALYLASRSFSSKSKIVHTVHNVLPHEKRFYHPLLYRLIYRNASAVIVHGQKIGQELKKVIGRRVPIIVIPHGNYALYRQIEKKSVDSLAERLGLKPNNKVILFFGAIRPYKGLDILLRAFRVVVTKLPEARLLIVGRPFGSFEPYQKLINDMLLSEKTIPVTRYIPGEEVAQYFAIADVAALPYLKTYESGIIHLAYAFGLPLVASKTGAIAETIEDGKSGLLVPPGKYQPLAEAILRILTDKELASALAKRGNELAQTKFSWENIAEQTFSLYKNLLEGRAPDD